MVIGGGTVGLRRAGVLARFGAEVTVISPRLAKELAGIHPDPNDSEGFCFAPHLPEELENFTLQAPLNGRLLQINQTGKKVKLICSTLK